VQYWLELDHVSKFFPYGFWQRPKQVLFDVTLQLPLGRSVGFVGPNGAGKTTLLKIVFGFIKPSAGQVRYPVYGNDSMLWRKHVGYLPERPYYQSFLTASEFLKLHHELSRSQTVFPLRAEELLKRLSLWERRHHKLKTFSKGMLQRVGLATCLIDEPDILILDEPMSGLDPDGRLALKNLLLEQKKAGKTLFFSSHLIEDVEAVGDDILILHQGRVIYFGDIQELKKRHQEQDLYRILHHLRVGEAIMETVP
jgi:ABC-2 type transport system ATP-binding protein